MAYAAIGGLTLAVLALCAALVVVSVALVRANTRRDRAFNEYAARQPFVLLERTERGTVEAVVTIPGEPSARFPPPPDLPDMTDEIPDELGERVG